MAETEILPPKESAAYRRCSERKQDRERAEGRGPAYVRIDGRIFYRRSDVDRFIAAHVCGGEWMPATHKAEATRSPAEAHKQFAGGCHMNKVYGRSQYEKVLKPDLHGTATTPAPAAAPIDDEIPYRDALRVAVAAAARQFLRRGSKLWRKIQARFQICKPWPVFSVEGSTAIRCCVLARTIPPTTEASALRSTPMHRTGFWCTASPVMIR